MSHQIWWWILWNFCNQFVDKNITGYQRSASWSRNLSVAKPNHGLDSGPMRALVTNVLAYQKLQIEGMIVNLLQNLSYKFWLGIFVAAQWVDRETNEKDLLGNWDTT